MAPAGDEDGSIAPPKQLHGAIQPELRGFLAVKVSCVGVRDQRHGSANGKHEPEALGVADVLGNCPCCWPSEWTRNVDYLHTVARK